LRIIDISPTQTLPGREGFKILIKSLPNRGRFRGGYFNNFINFAA
jgi:hypothetical protein